ncbi:hypothetical protein, partial [Tessaracoccus sp. OH4464_COT-324]
FFPIPRLAQGLPIILVTVVSIASVAGVELINQLPLKAYSMEWLPFALAGFVLGYVLQMFSSKEK